MIVSNWLLLTDSKHDRGNMAGKWTIAVTLKDNVRTTVLPLKTFFVLD